MRGADLINTVLPDELLIEILRRVEAKPERDACALVCRRWRRGERASRRAVKIAASGAADRVLELVVGRFTALADVAIDERLPSTCPGAAVARRARVSILASRLLPQMRNDLISRGLNRVRIDKWLNGFGKIRSFVVSIVLELINDKGNLERLESFVV
uniref:F-box domain-containing protein n=1 Tax=Ananas comosus var. bracteatus TaxID=296719 RepID=A0A6V7PFN9_ANACO|nr:unnamed protein product [Ananas comosus var. bracteatus]